MKNKEIIEKIKLCEKKLKEELSFLKRFKLIIDNKIDKVFSECFGDFDNDDFDLTTNCGKLPETNNKGDKK